MSQNTFQAPERLYTDEQLAKLLEISSAVDCECPNHLAKLVENLIAFELYSKDCESRNEEDAKIHAMLYQRSAEARAVMEKALKELVIYEKLVV